MYKKIAMWKRISCVILAAMSIITAVPMEAKADEFWPEGPSVNVPCAIVIEVNSGTVLYEKNSDEINYPASITKVMTTMLALEQCELDETVVFSEDAVYKNEGDTSHIARDVNEKMTVEETLYGVMLESANECAYAIAEHVGEKLGGNYQTFIDLMNERAKELGCTNTHFNNSNGLPDTEHWTSTRDMALIAAEAYRNETFRIITGSKRYVIPPTNKHKDPTYLNNHHRMIHNYRTAAYLYDYATGGKTGFTVASGYTLVSYAEKDGLSLACVVMRTNEHDALTDTRSLFEFCFENFEIHNISENEVLVNEEVKNKGFMNPFGSFVELDKGASIVLPATAAFEDATCTIKEGDSEDGPVAMLEYTYAGRPIGSAKIVASKVSAKENYFNTNSDEVDTMNVIKIKPVYIVLVVCGVIFLVVLILISKMLYDNYYVILHNMEVRRERKNRFRPIEKKRKRRRRRSDRMFR